MEPARQGDIAADEAVVSSEDGAASKSMSGGGAVGEDFAAAVPPASAPSAHYLLRNGDLSLLVARGQLLPTVDRIKAMTAALSGYVMSSSLGTQTGMGMPEPMPLDTAVSSDGSLQGSEVAGTQYVDGDPYASLVVRVPEQQFDTAIKRFSKLGEVRSASTSAEDVTSQFVDLQARLRHYRAVERRLLGFLDETTTVSQMLAVQDRIDQVQLTIEELSAQLKSMRETTTYGTLSVYVSEKDRTSGRDQRQQHLRWHLLELHRAARQRRARHRPRADRAPAVPRRLRPHRRARLVRRAPRAPEPPAGGGAGAAGLTAGAAGPAGRRLRPRPFPGRGSPRGLRPR